MQQSECGTQKHPGEGGLHPEQSPKSELETKNPSTSLTLQQSFVLDTMQRVEQPKNFA